MRTNRASASLLNKILLKINNRYFFPTFLFFLSRLYFINPKDVFFDSGEYLHLFSNPNYFVAIASGHFPPHEGYIIFFWPIFQLAKQLGIDPAYAVILGQIILSCLTVFFFYRLVLFIADRRTALLSSILLALIPLFWITNVSIMMETTYVFLFSLSLYLLTKYLVKKPKDIYLHLSLLSLSLAVLTHTMVILWIPFYLSIVFFKNKKLLIKTVLNITLYVAFFSLMNTFFLSSIRGLEFQDTFRHLYLSKGGEFASIQLNITGILIVARNFLIPLFRNNTSLIMILCIISLVSCLIKNKRLFIMGFLWTSPSLFTNQWWDSLLNGRHAILAGFGIVFLAAHLIRKNNILAILVICYLLLVSLPAMMLLKKDIPYIQEAAFTAGLPENSYLIESHFARPQVQDRVNGKVFYVNEPGYDLKKLPEIIDKYLAEKKPVYISSAALSEPYGLYSGPYLHNLTLSYRRYFELESVVANFKLVPEKEISSVDNLLIYRIFSKEKTKYPEVKNLKDSRRRIDYYDPIYRLSKIVTHLPLLDNK